jgi:uncharacterized protein with von Willebrand factor type A (vWA) domain
VNTASELPLFELFTRLREAGLPLGIDEYCLLLRALQGGFGLPDRSALQRLCLALWAKSDDDERILDYHFEQVMQNIGAGLPAPVTPEPDDDSTSAAQEPAAEASSDPVALPPPQPDLARILDDEVEVAQAFSPGTRPDLDAPARAYLLTSDYLPVTRRQMKQSWRHLRQPVREGPATELDLQATLDRLGHDGMLLEPVRIPPRVNRAGLFLFIDQEGSMMPFHAMSRRLTETALRGGRLGRAGIYYFHNCPDGYLYADSARQHAHDIESVLDRCRSERAGVLIFSDAGAARGGLVPQRVEITGAFLEQVLHRTRRTAWLNPMPRSRWPGTSAGEIALMVPMFELSQRGLHQAISALRGRLVYEQARSP